MFSFFKRSPKDKRKKSPPKEGNCLKSNKDVYKNNSKDVVCAPATMPPPPLEFGLCKNPVNCETSEVVRSPKSDLSMNDRPKREAKSASVKPCGHGTVAIAPYVPQFVGTKRERDDTNPQNSPQLETKKPFRTISKEEGKETTKNEPLMVNGSDSDSEKKNLINQEAKFQSQLNDLSKQLSFRDAEANKLRFQMEELQRDVFVKSAGTDRLQAELQAAYKESESIRNRIKHLETELAELREKNHQLSKELSVKSQNFVVKENEAKVKISELQSVIKQLQTKIDNLTVELDVLKQEKEKLEKQQATLVNEREEEKQKLAETIKQNVQQKTDVEKKWKEDFEKLRTVNILKEQQLLDDFEWKLREVQKTCKQKLEDKDKTIEQRLQDAYNEAEKKMKEAKQMMIEAETLKTYELEIEQLKGLTVNQEKAMKEMIDQQLQMKAAEDGLKNEAKRLRNLIELEKENLQHMQRKHLQDLTNKERTLRQTLREKRTEIAMYWEERLLTECARLKNELEQIHVEEKKLAMEQVRKQKDEEFEKVKQEWNLKIKDYVKEIADLKRCLAEKDDFYHEEVERAQTKTDRDIIELRRLMDKIDMTHHEKFEKLVQEHDQELERINEETERKIKETEAIGQNQISSLRATLELVKEQMEKESQQKIEQLIEQHRSELDSQWENLIRQKNEAIQLVEDKYISQYKMLEEQFRTQQKSHEAREIELLKTIDCLKNELTSKNSTIDDLQNNCDTLEGGIQVLNQEIAQQSEQIIKNRTEEYEKIRELQETINKLQEQQEQGKTTLTNKMTTLEQQSQENIDYLQKKCQCLTKLFEEVKLRYDRRESRQEDLNTISDLKQIIAEQEKDLVCLNEEKRYFQMRLMTVESRLEGSGDEDAFEDAQEKRISPAKDAMPSFSANTTFFIPPTIPECDE